ncbi:MAG TPA: phage minor head protein [Spirochaetales bacterium]|nr:phage minor head protein [Spirochaetales bacterium]
MEEVDCAGGPSAATLESPASSSVDEELVHLTEKLLTVSYLLGRDHVSTKLELADDEEAPAIPFDEAVEFMRARVPLTKKEWSILEPELRYRAFTVAALSTPDAINRVRTMATKAVEEGVGLSEFWTSASAESTAGIGTSPWYWETVYRTNVQTSYNAGRVAEFSRAQPEYIEFVGIEDGRQTEVCAQRSGVILPASHWFWKNNCPPLHFGCRSTLRAVFQEEVDSIKETNPNWAPTPDSMITRDPAGKSFGANPIETGSFYTMTPSMLARAKQYGLSESISSFAKRLGIEDLAIDRSGEAAVVETVEPIVAKELFGEIQDSELRLLAQESFKEAPTKIQSLVEAHAQDFSYNRTPGGSFYNSAERSITIGDRPNGYTFSHEFGHGIDHRVGDWFTSTDEFKAAFQSDLDTLVSSTSHRITAKGKAAVRDLEVKGWNDIPPISDLFSGLTAGKIEGYWSHSARYWAFPERRGIEVFADLFALLASGDSALWNSVHEYVPSLCDCIDSWLRRQ